MADIVAAGLVTPGLERVLDGHVDQLAKVVEILIADDRKALLSGGHDALLVSQAVSELARGMVVNSRDNRLSNTREKLRNPLNTSGRFNHGCAENVRFEGRGRRRHRWQRRYRARNRARPGRGGSVGRDPRAQRREKSRG